MTWQSDMPSAPGAVLAFDVGGTSIKAEVLGPQLDCWHRVVAPTGVGSQIVSTLAGLAEQLLDALTDDQRAEVDRAAVVLPGVVDTAQGHVVFAANLGLRDEPISEPLSDLLALPVVLGHDVTAAAEAERYLGAARDLLDPLIVVIGTGIAATSYVNGHLVRGSSGQAGELGHVVVTPGGPRCGCGASGCLETLASASAITRAYAAQVGRQGADAREVAELARRGDPQAAAVWQRAAHALADGLSTACALLAPDGIVLGGGLAEAGDLLIEPVVKRMRKRRHVLATPPVRAAELGSRAGVVGAGRLAFHSQQASHQGAIERQQVDIRGGGRG